MTLASRTLNIHVPASEADIVLEARFRFNMGDGETQYVLMLAFRLRRK